MQPIPPLALFRLSVLGALTARDHLERGELKLHLQALAARSWLDPDGQTRRISAKTLESWYYAYRHGGLDALAPKPRCDRGVSKIDAALQTALLAAKRDNPRRSLRGLIHLLEMNGTVARGTLSRSAVHRLLAAHGVSQLAAAAGAAVERRRFVAAHAGDLWQGDVLHGPKISVGGRLRKVYLVSLMDDASRLIAHSAFYPDEGALSIEAVLKQALLKRGVPRRLLIDNGPAYRSASLQGVCARLGIQLVYCAPYEPEAKGKLERWHRTARQSFLSELDLQQVRNLDDLNARLWAWLEVGYHATVHSALDGLTPLARYQRDLVHVRPLGTLAPRLDELFWHRHPRSVRKDGTVSFAGKLLEVPYELSGRRIVLVVDPHRGAVVGLESETGESLGQAVPLDAQANLRRKRCRPAGPRPASTTPPVATARSGPNAVELALARQRAALGIADLDDEEAR